ncbi:hypothetical protein C0992_009229 [Termitomyces sp. T32_za158]|nr:hypothetical protein C0992_009229 [Termitomyces sp. T32_za158]
MKLPSSSSLVAAALITSSSIPSLAAPATLHSQKHMTIFPVKRLVSSQSENIVHRAAEKDKVHEEDNDEGKKNLISDLIDGVLCLVKLKDCGPKDKGPEHEKRFKGVVQPARK